MVRTEIAPMKERFIAREVTPYKRLAVLFFPHILPLLSAVTFESSPARGIINSAAETRRQYVQRYEHSAAIDFTKPISSGSAQAVIASGKFTSPLFFSLLFLPPFFHFFFKSPSLTPRAPESFIRASVLVSSSCYCGNPRLKRARKMARVSR